MGFSRGGYLPTKWQSSGTILGLLSLWHRPIHPSLNLSQAGAVSAPVLALVSENDTGSRRTRGRNTLKTTQQLFRALKEADKDTTLIVYPAYGDDGHTLFFSVGSYWTDVIAFLHTHL
jgi:hypothetical protein